jgi:hypothetical protein
MKNEELKPAEQAQITITPTPHQSRTNGATISGVQRELSDVDLGRVAGGPRVYNEISTITDLADEDLRQAAGGPRIYNE